MTKSFGPLFYLTFTFLITTRGLWQSPVCLRFERNVENGSEGTRPGQVSHRLVILTEAFKMFRIPKVMFCIKKKNIFAIKKVSILILLNKFHK